MTDWGKLYAEAVEREGDVRDLAFLGESETVLGLEVRPLTARHILWLQLARSPMMTGAPVDLPNVPAFIEQFLRIVITNSIHTPSQDRQIDRVLTKTIKKEKVVDLVMEIKSYLDEAFMDAPGGKPTRAYYSRIAPLVHFLCSEENFTLDQALDTPLKVTFQLMKICRQQNNSKCILFNPSDNITSQWLKSGEA